MAGIKISDLPAVPSAQLTDVFPVDQGSVTYKENNQQLLTLFKSDGEELSRINDTNVTMTLGGSPTTALLNATSMTLGWTGQLSVPRGGTGNSTFTAYSVICAGTTATGAFQNVSGVGTAAQVLTSNGAAALPTWQAVPSPAGAALTKVDDANVTLTLGGTPATALLQAVGITAGWAGQLSVPRGGTGNSTFTAYSLITAGTTSTGTFQNVSGVGTLNQVLISQGAAALPQWGTVPGLTPAALTKTDDTNVTLTLGGTPSTALLQATSITAGWTGQLSVARGGTGLAALTAHYIPIGNGTTALTLLAPNATSGIPLISQGAAADPAYGTAVVAGGGTGNTTFTAYSVITAGTTATGAFQNVSGVGSLNQVLISQGAGALPQWGAVPGAVTPAALTKTDDTNVTLTLGGTPTTALLQATSITAGWTGQLGLTRGGTAASLTASTGGIVYSGASALAILSGTATARQMLQSGANAAPAWSTATYPATVTANRILYASATNVVSDLASANSSVLVTDGSGVPSLSTTLPAFTTSSITFSPTTGGIVGTTTNDDAAAGKVGEFKTASAAQGSPSGLPGSTSQSIVSISLTAGDWDVTGIAYFYPDTTTSVQQIAAGISTASNSLGGQFSIESCFSAIVRNYSQYIGLAVIPQRISIASTTTVYLVGNSTFTVSTMGTFGTIQARRMR